MPNTTLTTKEIGQIESQVSKQLGDYWVRGLNNPNALTDAERNLFYSLGSKILSDEGFSAFYQGQIINGSVQELIDRTARAYIAVNAAFPLTLDFMPLTTMSGTDFE